MTAHPVLRNRQAGLLLHPTSLPGPGPTGDIGHIAYRFVEFLQAAGFRVWQTLPLGPTHEDGSPYQCLSVHAGNLMLISLDWLVDRGWLKAAEIKNSMLDLHARQALLSQAHERFATQRHDYHDRFSHFIETESYWLDDYALFMAIRQQQQQRGWMHWPAPLRERDPDALNKAGKKLDALIQDVRFEQFIFFCQWQELKSYAHEHDVSLFGDMPIFVAHDSAEVWAHREYFTVDEHGTPTKVAGVPPDYFSETGQRWGNPLYNWERMRADGFQWWVQRMRTQMELFDIIRIDHFRGFEACWEIDANEETAMNGHWVKTPGLELLDSLHHHLDPLPIIAEDLGTITPEVDALRQHFNIPGMKILQFAFDGNPTNPYLPHNHVINSVVYTGTHDNDTTLSWYAGLSDSDRDRVMDYLGRPGTDMPWPVIRAALASVAALSIIPMQDILALGSGHRMNTPGTQEDNWQWRFDWSQLSGHLAGELHHLNWLYHRLP